MHPLVKTAPVVAVLVLLGGAASVRSPVRANAPLAGGTAAAPSLIPPDTRVCASGTLALDPGGPCVPLPRAADADQAARERLLSREPPPMAYRVAPSREEVVRLPERPVEWARYQLPLEPVTPPDPDGRPRDAEAPVGGVRLAAPRGTPVQLVELEAQSGEGEVVAVGELRGITVVTRHRVAREGATREYLVFHSRLEQPGPRVTVGARLGPLAVVGFVGGQPSALELDVVELRAPLAAPPTHLADLEKPSVGFSVDPRNVLPLRP